jgi:hypothetical protein
MEEYRVMTLGRLKRVNQNAMECGLPRWARPAALEQLDSDGICLAKATRSERCGPRVPHYRVLVLTSLGHEMTVDMLPEDWNALPTVAEFDAELDLFEAAVRGTR